MKKTAPFMVGGTISFVLSIIGFIVFAVNGKFLNTSEATRETHNAFAQRLGELSAEAMNNIARVGIIGGIAFLALGIVLIVLAVKRKNKIKKGV